MQELYVITSADSAMLDAWRAALGSEVGLIELRRFDELPNCLARLRPRLVLLDMRLVRTVGAISGLRAVDPEARIVVFADDDGDEDQALALLRAGARGVCRLDANVDIIARAVAAVLRGELWIRRTLMPRLVDGLMAERADAAASRTGKFAVLTPREIEIVQLIGQGASNKRIASQLAITERTVKGHLTAVFRKTGIVDRLKLAVLIARRPKTSSASEPSTQ